LTPPPLPFFQTHAAGPTHLVARRPVVPAHLSTGQIAGNIGGGNASVGNTGGGNTGGGNIGGGNTSEGNTSGGNTGGGNIGGGTTGGGNTGGGNTGGGNTGGGNSSGGNTGGGNRDSGLHGHVPPSPPPPLSGGNTGGVPWVSPRPGGNASYTGGAQSDLQLDGSLRVLPTGIAPVGGQPGGLLTGTGGGHTGGVPYLSELRIEGFLGGGGTSKVLLARHAPESPTGIGTNTRGGLRAGRSPDPPTGIGAVGSPFGIGTKLGNTGGVPPSLPAGIPTDTGGVPPPLPPPELPAGITSGHNTVGRGGGSAGLAAAAAVGGDAATVEGARVAVEGSDRAVCDTEGSSGRASDGSPIHAGEKQTIVFVHI